MSADFPQAGPALGADPKILQLAGQPDTFAPEAPSWGPVTAGRTRRTWRQWRFLQNDTREGEIGSFCRRARSDQGFPDDPTRVLTYLVGQLAPDHVLQVAKNAIAEFRKWFAEGLELALAEVARVQPARAEALRASLAGSLAALDRLYAVDAAVLEVEGEEL
jgi:hypothetical protein